jgi:fatty acid desaturase
VIFVVGVCKVNLWFYVFGIVYPGTSLSLVRSFVEHRASQAVEEQTAIVENAKILGALFLFNNLHVVHHQQPDLPWYRIPKWYHDHHASLVAPKAVRVYNGYFEIVRRFFFAPFDDPVHPLIP